MRKKRSPKDAAPVWAFLIVWLLFSLLGVPVYKLSGILLTAGAGVLAGVLTSAVQRKRKKKNNSEEMQTENEAEESAAAEKPKAEEEASPYSPEVQKIIKEGRMAMKEMGRLYSSIQNPSIRAKINEIMSVSDRIIRDAIDDPRDVPQIRKFLDYYLPTTIKLLNAYDRMSVQEYAGENISGSMDRIENMLDTSIKAYKKQLDALFANQAADIQVDIDTMNGMLAREGLGGKSYLDLNEFMKEYEKQKKKEQQQSADTSEKLQKGSTSNG